MADRTLPVIVLLLACFVGAGVAYNEECAGIDFECTAEDCPTDCDSPFFKCYDLPSHPSGKECDHKDISPLEPADFGLVITLFACLALASGAGIGGGGVIIPLLLLIAEIPTHYGVPLSVTSIVGGSIVRSYMQVTRHHPNPKVAHRNLIDFWAVLTLLPMTLAGTVIGVLVNSVAPSWLIVATIFIVLTFVTYKTLKNAFRLHHREQEETRKLKQNSQAMMLVEQTSNTSLNAPEETTPEGNTVFVVDLDAPLDSSNTDENGEPLVDPINMEKKISPELQQILDREAKFPWKFIIVSFLELGVLIFLSLTRGGSDESYAGISCGSNAYWGIIVATFFFLLGCAMITAWFAKQDFERKTAAGYEIVEGDVHFGGANAIKLPLVAIAVGFTAGFLGIGGGMVLGPTLLALGMIPQVSSATTSYMTLFTSTSSTLQFIVLGRVLPGYGVTLFITALLASYVGQKGIMAIVQKYNKNSAIVFLLAGIIGMATVLLVVTGTINIIDDANEGKSFGFRELCD